VSGETGIQLEIDPALTGQWPCCSEGCRRTAVEALWFNNQLGHIHECAHHSAMVREWFDVAGSCGLPCPLTHQIVWTDAPPGLA
jgi:hypothetical protein